MKEPLGVAIKLRITALDVHPKVFTIKSLENAAGRAGVDLVVPNGFGPTG
jgi:hypothetical protein